MAHGRGHQPYNDHRSSERHFLRPVIRIDGKPVGCRRIKCASPSCEQEGEILDRSAGGLPTSMVEKKFVQKGWEVGANEKHDYCPSCVEARRIARRTARIKPISPNVVSISTSAATAQQEAAKMTTIGATAEAPPEMTREAKRTIFAKLQDVYLDEERGYQSPWTDQAVAKDLGCPLAWIVQVRDDNFGPASDNSEIRALLGRVESAAAEAKAVLNETKAVRKEVSELVEKINSLAKKATEMARNLEGVQATADRIASSVRRS